VILRVFLLATACCLLPAVSAAWGQETSPETLPAPSARPMEIDLANDPILRLRHQETDFRVFRDLIAQAVAQHPAKSEAVASEEEAEALVDQAREARYPSLDAAVTSYHVISREFSNDPQNIIERSRPSQRTDATLQLNQTLFDFGAGADRVGAAGARLRAASADLEGTADRVALNAVAAWQDVFGYRALVRLTESFLASEMDLRASVEERIRQGVSAEGDLARADSYIAQTQTRLAQYRRQQAGAEARFASLTGAPPPPGLARVPAPGGSIASQEDAAAASQTVPIVRSAEAGSQAANREASAAHADRLPQLSGGFDAGRYGVFENERDYDVRGRLTLRMRLFGPTDPWPAQYDARARAADARAERVREEAARDASIAWSDVQALGQQLDALELSYAASRRSRDVILARFEAARGSLFDVVQAEEAYFESATAYIQALIELDTARYVLLSRTGRLLDQLNIDDYSGDLQG
jgi:adhesin transport system outer membrane protein